MNDVVKILELPEGKYRITAYESSTIPQQYVALEVEFQTDLGWYTLKKLRAVYADRVDDYITAAEKECREGLWLGVLTWNGILE
jgi:hypothetical protein